MLIQGRSHGVQPGVQRNECIRTPLLSSQLLSLVPSVMKARPSTITTIAEMYSNDLPSPALVEEEYERWKAEFQQIETDDLHYSCAKAKVRCDRTRFPNIFMLLKIACTLPVTSA